MIQCVSFSTAKPFLVNPPKRSGSLTGPPKRGARALQLKKKVRERTGKPPAPGERKALKKRIVLSNTNALEVEGLRDIDATSIADENITGHIVGLPGDIVDKLRAVDAFKTTQSWKLFRRPACLWRKDNAELGKLFAKSQKDAVRRIIVGEGGCGKSVFLLQAMCMAFLKGWVVINLPDGKLYFA
jgi:small subunit ribosomal protein S29